MRRLWVQLTFAFALVTLMSVAVAALLANRQTSTQFRGFLVQNQIQESGLPAELAAYYQARQNWDGVDTLFSNWRSSRGGGAGNGMMRGAPGMALADADGRVVYSTVSDIGMAFDADQRASAIPIPVDTATAGYLLIRSSGSGLTAAAEQFLGQVNRSLIQAGLVGAILGALLGLFLARGMAAPLDHLATAARRLAHGDLAQRVAVGGPTEVVAAGEAFNEMASALERAEELRRRMVADIAHELRTPLTVIQGNLQAILDDVYPLEKAEIQTILDETVLLSRLVDDLRELALAEAGQLRLQPRVINTVAFINQSVAAFHGAASARNLTLAIQCPPELPAAWADPQRAGQVLHNLLANALRHTPPEGQITIQAMLSAADDPQPAIKIIVQDTGPGIAPEDLPHVFERFWRADRARARIQGGSGLGLAIARQLVHAQHGEIGVNSTFGQGSQFWFTLPIAPRS